MMGITITLGNDTHKILVDNKGRGVNGDTTRDEIMPKVLEHFSIDYSAYELTNFRYYLGQAIYKLKVHMKDGRTMEGHYVTTKVMGNTVISL